MFLLSFFIRLHNGPSLATHAVYSDVALTLTFFNNCRLTTVRLIQFENKHFELVARCLNQWKNTKGRLHDKSLKITLGLNSRLPAVDCINTGLTSLRLTLGLNSRLLPVDCIN